jgi:hypothetical protein
MDCEFMSSKLSNIVNGLANILDVIPINSYPIEQIKRDRLDETEDCVNLQQDWINVGNDIQKAINKYKNATS